MKDFATFAALHVPGDPVVLYNVWDAGSAKVVVEAGGKAIATGSHPLADALGLGDGQQVPLDLVFANARRIVAAVDVPVTIDFEGAYSDDAGEGAANVLRLKETGAVGCNFEDQGHRRRRASPDRAPGRAYPGDPPRRRGRFLHQRPHRPSHQGPGSAARRDHRAARPSRMAAPAAFSSRVWATRARWSESSRRRRCRST